MASETKTENVMLSGQTAYFKKTGSMANRGTLDLPNANMGRTYAEGYIGPNSVLHGTDLATTADYVSAENTLQTYLSTDWREESQERSLITNSNVIIDTLTPYYAYFDSLAKSTDFDGDDLLEYISSTGAQYINTGIKPDANTKVEVTLSNVATNATGTIFGHDFNVNGFVLAGFQDHLGWHYSGNKDVIASNNITAKHTISIYRRQIILDGTTILNNTSAYSRTYSNNINIFGIGTTQMLTWRLYDFKIYKSNVLVQHLIPVKRRINNNVCLYDMVTEQYFNTPTSTPFLAGPVKTE